MKKCVICDKEFEGHGRAKVCSNDCRRLRKNQTNKKYQNKPEIQKLRKSLKYKEIARKSDKQWYSKNKDKKLATNAKWKQENIEHCKKWHRDYKAKREACDVNFKISNKLRTRLWHAIKNKQKTGSAVNDLGCTIEELKIHLENLFQEGMTWENYGKWHIDHIKALANFDLMNREELLKACNYSNLQPMWAEENLSWGVKNKSKMNYI